MVINWQNLLILFFYPAKKRGIDVKGARVVIQGFGNAGSFLAKFMHDLGAKVIAIYLYLLIYGQIGVVLVK